MERISDASQLLVVIERGRSFCLEFQTSSKSDFLLVDIAAEPSIPKEFVEYLIILPPNI
jgi:hypothetical protein